MGTEFRLRKIDHIWCRQPGNSRNTRQQLGTPSHSSDKHQFIPASKPLPPGKMPQRKLAPHHLFKAQICPVAPAPFPLTVKMHNWVLLSHGPNMSSCTPCRSRGFKHGTERGNLNDNKKRRMNFTTNQFEQIIANYNLYSQPLSFAI